MQRPHEAKSILLGKQYNFQNSFGLTRHTYLLINDNKKRYIQCVCSLSSCRELKLFPHVSQLKDAFTLELDSSDFSPVSL